MQGFMAHRGTKMVSRGVLRELPAPESKGPMHRPIPHIELVDTIDRSLKMLGMNVVRDDMSIGKNSIFGMLTTNFKMQNEAAFTVGFRSDNAQRFGVKVIAGANIFVCDNMALLGDWLVCAKKHTTGLDLFGVIRKGLDTAAGSFIHFMENDLERFKTKGITREHAKSFIFDLANDGYLPLAKIRAVWAEYTTPQHEEFVTGTVWGLLNAVTEVAKQLPAGPRMELLTEVARKQNSLLA